MARIENTALKFGNSSAYCDFERYGSGVNGYDSACNEESSSHACRIRNVDTDTYSADSLLESELSLVAPVWPSVRCPAEQARAELRAAERVYRQHIRNSRKAFFQSEKNHWNIKRAESLKAYLEARQNLRTYISALDLTP